MDWVKVIDHFWKLKLIRNPSDIFELDYNKIRNLEGWGDLSVKNLKNAIEQAKKINLNRFIFSIGIRHIGQENAKILASFFKNILQFTNLFNKTKRDEILKNLRDLDGIGETQILSIDSFFKKDSNVNIVKKLITKLNIQVFREANKTGKLVNTNVMFTGGFKKSAGLKQKHLLKILVAKF